MGMGDRRNVSFLTTAEFDRLNHACMAVTEGLADTPYLVGSAMQGGDYRDVDVRSILPDDMWDSMFRGRRWFWSLFCSAVSLYLSEVSGLPVDYQAQRMSEANEKFGGKSRNPIGTRARLFAGGGDACPDPDSEGERSRDAREPEFAAAAELEAEELAAGYPIGQTVKRPTED